MSPLRLALLDRRFALRIVRWPEIHAVLMRRLITPTRRLSPQAAINALPRVEERVELTLWRLGDRFGRVTPEGVVLRLALRVLARSLGLRAQPARRPANLLFRLDKTGGCTGWSPLLGREGSAADAHFACAGATRDS